MPDTLVNVFDYLVNLRWIDWVGHVSFAIGAWAYFCRDMIRVRSLVIVSFVISIFFNTMAGLPFDSMVVVVFWLSVFTFINAYRLYHDVQERREIPITHDDMKKLMQTEFRNMTAVQFLRLMECGVWQSFDKGVALSSQAVRMDHVILIKDGAVLVERAGAEPFVRESGSFIGEIGYLTDRVEPETTTVIKPVHAVVWERQALDELFKEHETLKKPMLDVLACEVMEKYLKTETLPPKAQEPQSALLVN